MGEVFAGRYELLDPIATGGMGTVWRVLDRTAGDVKAAKMLRQADAAMLLRFVREQSVRIDHTHVVTPQSWAGVDDRVLFTMPLVRGGSVSSLMKRHGGRLPPRWIAVLADQTLQALEAVHAARIVHRDIKPGNLLLEPTGTGRPHLRLTDFGIAVPSDEPRLTHVAMMIGTPGYMPPELYRGADPDPSADVYALGIVVLEMLTGRRPPSDGEPAPIDVAALRTGVPEHDAVLEVVAAATTYDAGRRPSAAELRTHPALRGLVARWDDPALADDLGVPDDFPPTPDVSATNLPTAPYPPPPPPPPPPRTRPDLDAPVAAVRTRAPRDAYVLLGVGLLGLLVALVLLLG
ncbi:serine/threonine-protein kinase [Pimelobacter simplex]|uniref:serine/threonine-protein kinase n=1 Tax=Nocardioides simplex TaxID=2045 RepID=UPI0021501583|nr:serine/threonine-protein kinase [Pimelobacter simplex]UUW91286.1 serine/threonine protein kinase [Pimelobacter simplex]UUW95114.1 serine/threonine protein kinase [Pimelobacter simplex]